MINFFKRVISTFKTLFFSGFVTIVPFSLTIVTVAFAYNIVARSLAPLKRLAPLVWLNIPGAEFVLAMVFILLIGVILRVFLISALVEYGERLIARIPLVRIIYSSAKILVDFFKMSDASQQNKHVVLIQYPREGNYHLAFLLESASDSYAKIIPDSFKKNADEHFVKVFMPNSPNPTTGYFFILPERDIIYTDITFEEAIKTLVSCGLITPDSLKNLSSKK